ncbi:MAG TPA: SDR family NAD(P)-dependent oxidoreductase [Terriglobia bacterium]|nr:SDR family NAD(P)-dependent oxidoreductase [Terriglobia bacterium]
MPTQRAVMITGSSTGIGEACALHLDRLGLQVFAGVRKNADGEALRRKASAALQPVRIDITSSEGIRAAAEMVRSAVGESGLAGLVNLGPYCASKFALEALTDSLILQHLRLPGR